MPGQRMDVQGPALTLAFFLFLSCCAVQLKAAVPPGATETYNRAVKLFEKGKWAAAKDQFHQYLAEYSDTPLYVVSLYYLAFCYQKLDDTQEALTLYNKVLEQAGPGDEAFWAQMAQKRMQELKG